MYFACNMPHYSPYELVNPAKMAAVAGFLPSYLDFSDRLLVYTDYLTAVFGPRTRLPKLSEQDGKPHIIYIGTPAFSGSFYDDVRGDLRMLADEQIHVHFAEPDLAVSPHPFLHTFPAFGPEAVAKGQLSDFMTQFDANLVVYHPCFSWCLRWRTTHSTRFLHGLLTGIPTVLPHGVFAASEEVIENYGVGYSFRSPRDLADWLQASSSIHSVEKNSLRMASHFTGETNVGRLTSFFEEIA